MTVLSIENLQFQGEYLVVYAFVDEVVPVRAATSLEPAEWGPALCRGTLYFSDEDLIPATDAQFRRMLTERIDDWSPIDDF